uniref:Uncharacterized protein n=1 Tax=Thermocrinis ruber TaxID=75906 RepID=A0A7C5SZB1_9AQUI
MRKRVFLALVLIASLLSLVWLAGSKSTTSKSLTKTDPSTVPSMPSKEAISAKLATLERGWVKNEGQWDERALFSAPGYFGTTWITKDGQLLHVAVKKEECKEQTTKAQECPSKSWVISERWVGGKVKAITPQEELPTKVSYFVGNDPSKYKTNLPTYRYVSLGEVWSGVEVKLKATQKTVEKLFYIKPSADLSKIVVQVDGAKGLKLSKDGEIIIQTGLGELKLSKPVAWQEKDGKKLPVEVSYKLIGKNRYSFEVAKADPSLQLVIDPILQATYLGGGGDDYAYAIAIHPKTGNVYVAGYTSSSDFPKTAGGAQESCNACSPGFYFIRPSYDAFVAKLNPELTQILQATYLGGSNSDYAYALAIHPITGDVYIAGRTESTLFPATDGGAQPNPGVDPVNVRFDGDGFISRLNSDLTELFQSTFLGGTDKEEIRAIAIHPATGEVYVAGWTNSTDFPKTAGGAQANPGVGFASRLSADLKNLIQSTYVAGYTYALAIHPQTGEIYVAGETNSTNFPKTTGGAQPTFGGLDDAFVARLNKELTQILQATYLGGSGVDSAYAIAIHPTTGDVYVAGTTSSTDFPKTAGGAQVSYGGEEYDAFVSRLNKDLTQIIQSTYLGGSDRDWANSLAIHPATGDVYVVGATKSADFPATAGGAQASCSTCNKYPYLFDAFVSRLNKDLTQILQSTYLGGFWGDYANAIAIHPQTGDVYVAGDTYSPDFPRTVGGAQSSFGGGRGSDAFVARITADLQAGKVLSINPKPTYGYVKSTPNGIYCGYAGLIGPKNACSADFIGTITLTAVADTGYKFTGWSGDCAGCGTNPTCTINMDANKSCSANFVFSGSPGGGSGGSPGGISGGGGGSGSGSGGSGSGTGSGSGGGGGGGGGCSMTGSASSMAGVWNILVWASVPAFALARRVRRK